MNTNVTNPKRIYGVGIVCSAFISLLQFLIFYFSAYLFFETSSFIIVAPYLVDFLEGLVPIGSAMVIFLTKGAGLKSKILPIILISLPRLLYTLPYYYVRYVTDVFNTEEALIIALLLSIFYLLFFFLETFVCILLLNWATGREKRTEREVKKFNIFDFDDGINFGVLLSAVFIFSIFFFRECVDTVSYFIEVGSGYYINEIFTIVISYLLLPAFAFIHYLICALLKSRITKTKD